MRYLKSLVAGLVASLAVLILSVLVPIVAAVIWAWAPASPQEGGIGAFSVPIPHPAVLIVGPLCFVAAFWWQFRRSSRHDGSARDRG